MPQPCSICNHASRSQIEAAIVAGKSLRDIARQFQVSRDAVHRHKRNCLTTAIATVADEQQRVQAEQTEQSGWNALKEMQWLHSEARKIYAGVWDEKDVKKRDPRLALSALAEIRKQTELFSELLSGIEQTSEAKLEQEYSLLRDVIFAALEPFPEARLAVARALLAFKDAHEAAGQLDQA